MPPPRRWGLVTRCAAPARWPNAEDALKAAATWLRSCVKRPVSRSSAPTTGNSVLGLRFDRPSSIAQIAPRLFAHGASDVFGKSNQRLTGRAAAALKGAVIGVEGRQQKGMPD